MSAPQSPSVLREAEEYLRANPPTRKQMDLLRFIHDGGERGRSYEEMRIFLAVKYHSTLRCHLKTLHRKGLISWPYLEPRGIRVSPRGVLLLEKENGERFWTALRKNVQVYVETLAPTAP